MKNLIMIIVAGLLSFISLKSQTSGWIYDGDIRAQKLSVKDIVDITVNPEKKLLYTLQYYYDNIKRESYKSVYRWNYETGELIDSIDIPKLIPVQFSTDGKYLLFVDKTVYSGKIFTSNISIFSLEEEKIVKSYLFTSPKDLNCKNYEDYSYEVEVNYDKLDYDSYRNLIFISINFTPYKFNSFTGTQHSLTYYSLGGYGIFDLNDDTLKIYKQLSKNQTFDNISVKDKIFITSYTSTDNNSSYGSSIYRSIKKDFYLTYIDIISNRETTIGHTKFEYNESHSGSGASSSKTGVDIPFMHLGYNSELDKVLVTYNNTILSYDYINDWQGIPITLDTNTTVSHFCNNGKYALGLRSDSLFFINIKNRKIEERIKLPFGINKMKLIDNESKLLLINRTTSFAELQVPKCFNINSIELENKINNPALSPNPAKDFLTINLNPSEGLKPSEGSVVEIYNSFGELVLIDVPHLQDVAHLKRIDISQLPAGLYFVKIGDRVAKFVKM